MTKPNLRFILIFSGIIFCNFAWGKTHLVDQLQTPKSVGIFSLNPIQVEEAQFDAGQINDAFIRLQLTGTLEGNLCDSNTVLLEQKAVGVIDPQNKIWELTFKSSKSGSDILNLE